MSDDGPVRDGRAAMDAPGASVTFDAALARALVADVTATDRFQKSPRQTQLLEYLVEAECRGEGARTSAYSVAFDVFHRDSDFDPAIDSSVRVEMHRLRANLNQWASDPNNPRDVALSFQPRSYRPVIVARHGAEPAQPVEAAAALPPSARFGRRAWGVAMATLIVACLAGMAYWIWGTGNSECRSARPYVVLPDAIEGDGEPARARAMLRELESFIQYYPLADGVHRTARLCPGVPVYTLDLTRSPDDANNLIATLSIGSESRMAIWQDHFELSPGASRRDGDIVMAQIAYALGSGSGEVAMDAVKRKWGNRRAFAEFTCVNRTHEYFIMGVRADYEGVKTCLANHFETSNRADVAGLLAALLSDRQRISRLTAEQGRALYLRAEARAVALDANNSEILTAQLRRARNLDHVDIILTYSLVDRMTRAFPFEPSVLNQVAISQAMFTGDWDKAAANLDTVRRIMRRREMIEWPQILISIARDEPESIEPYLPQLSASDVIFGKLATLYYATQTEDPAMVARVRRELASGDCETRACLLHHIRHTGYHDAIKARLSEAVRRSIPT